MHSVNSDMQLFALLESQFMDVHKEPKSTWKSSDATNVHASEYLHRGIQSFYTHSHEVSQRSLPLYKSRKAKSHMLQFLHA